MVNFWKVNYCKIFNRCRALPKMTQNEFQRILKVT